MKFKTIYAFEAAPLSDRLSAIFGGNNEIDECIAADTFNCACCRDVVLPGRDCLDVKGCGFCGLDCLEDYLFEAFGSLNLQPHNKLHVISNQGGT